jgi:hypothetical protein
MLNKDFCFSNFEVENYFSKREKYIEDFILNSQPIDYIKIEVHISAEEIENNDGRKFCFKCGQKTRIVSTGFVKVYDICPVCKI